LLERSNLFYVAVVVAAGCHTRPATVGNGADETTGAESTDSDDWGESAETGATEAGDTGTGEPNPSAFCESADWPDDGRPVAAIQADTFAPELVYADGTVRTLELDAGEAPPDASSSLLLRGTGLFVATVLRSNWVDDGVHYQSRVTLFDHAGEELWVRTDDGFHVQAAYPAESGSITGYRWDGNLVTEGFMYDEDGGFSVLGPTVRPVAPERGDGLVPVQLFVDGVPTTHAWVDPVTQDVQTVMYEQRGNWLRIDDGNYTFIAQEDGAVGVAVESPIESTFDPLPDLGVEADQLSIWHPDSERWMLLSAEDHTRWWRVDLETANAQELDLDAPAGYDAFDCYSPFAVIDAKGHVLRSMRNAQAGSIQRLDPDVDVWNVIGRPVGDIDQITAQLYGDAMLIYGAGAGTTFCPWQEWLPGGTELLGTQVQLIPPFDGDSILLTDYQSVSVNRAGTCAAMIDADDRFVMLDTINGETTWVPIVGGYVTWF
jgi:hypothetical protein